VGKDNKPTHSLIPALGNYQRKTIITGGYWERGGFGERAKKRA